MALTPPPLTVLRLAMAEQPFASELARKIGCSQQLLASFERGLTYMGDVLLTKYGSSPIVTARAYCSIRTRWCGCTRFTWRRLLRFFGKPCRA